jgi:hypothetical protein
VNLPRYVGKCSPKPCSSCSLSARLTFKLVRGWRFFAFPGLETGPFDYAQGRLRGTHFRADRSCAKSRSPSTSSGQAFTPLTPIALASDRGPESPQ